MHISPLFSDPRLSGHFNSLQVPFKGACWALWKNTQVEVRKELDSRLPLSEPSDLGEVTQTLSALFSLARRGCTYIAGFLWRFSMARQRTHQAYGWARGTYSTEMRSPLLFSPCVLPLRALVHFGASGRTLGILLSPGRLRKLNSNEASGISDRVHVFIIIHLGFEKQTSPIHSFGCYSNASRGWFFFKDRITLPLNVYKCLSPSFFLSLTFVSPWAGVIFSLSLFLVINTPLPSSFAFLLSTFFRESCDIMQYSLPRVHPECGAEPKWIFWCIFHFLPFHSWMLTRREKIVAWNKKKRFGENASSGLMNRTVYLASYLRSPTGISTLRSPKLDLCTPVHCILPHLWWQPHLPGCLDAALIAVS